MSAKKESPTLQTLTDQVRQDAEALCLRIGQIFWLDPMLACWDGDSLDDSGLGDLLCYDLDPEHLDASMEPFRAVLDGEDEYEMVAELLEGFAANRIAGVIVCAEQPVFMDATPTSCSYSWGRRCTQHFMAPTLEQAWGLAKQWAQDNWDEAVAKTAASEANSALSTPQAGGGV